MSNIGKLTIMVPLVEPGNNHYTDQLTEMKGYQEERLKIYIRKNKNSEIKDTLGYKQIIISREIKAKKPTNIKCTKDSEEYMWLKLSHSLNIPTYLDVLVNKSNFTNQFELFVQPHGQIKDSDKDWGLLRSKLNEIIDTLYLLKERENIGITSDVDNKLRYKTEGFNMFYKYGIIFRVKGIGYRVDYNNNTREIELYIGYSNIIKKKLPETLEIKVLNGTEILILPKYNIKSHNNSWLIESASFNKITQFSKKLHLIKPAYKDIYKNQGCEIEILRF